MCDGMRLSCDCSVTVRCGEASAGLTGSSVGRHARPCRSFLSLGCKDGKKILVLSTQADRAGKKYTVSEGNLQQAFVKFASEGKSTLRFQSPHHDLCLSKADPVQLKAFLSVLKAAAQGKEVKGINLSALNPASTAQVSKPKTKLIISEKREYPITTSFPHTLEVLVLAGLNLKRVDSRILKLQRLRELDFSENSLGPGLCEKLGEMRTLQHLNVSYNKIANPLPIGFCRSRLSDTLTSLDLSGNGIKELPTYICHLASLITLVVKNNELSRLPHSLGRLKRLRFLNADNNQLKTLPGGLVRIGLERLDISNNPFRDRSDSGTLLLDRLGFPSLEDLCLKACVANKIGFEAGSVPLSVLRNFDMREHCRCRKVCFTSRAVVLNAIPLLSVASEVGSDYDAVLFEAVVCSRGCLVRFATNMFAF